MSSHSLINTDELTMEVYTKKITYSIEKFTTQYLLFFFFFAVSCKSCNYLERNEPSGKKNVKDDINSIFISLIEIKHYINSKYY